MEYHEYVHVDRIIQYFHLLTYTDKSTKSMALTKDCSPVESFPSFFMSRAWHVDLVHVGSVANTMHTYMYEMRGSLKGVDQGWEVTGG